MSLSTTALLIAGVATSAAIPHVVPMGAHRVDRPPHSRALQSQGDGHEIPAGGAVFPTAIYWAKLQIGTPPQDFAVGLDSGSGDLFVEGKGCDGCTSGPPNNAYDPQASSTSKKAFPGFFIHTYKTCDLKKPSATCTMRGATFTDQISLAGLGPVQVKFGAIKSQSANFDTKKVVGGLMGLQSGEDGQDVLATLVAAGKCDNVWGLCMNEGRVSNGTLTVGGVDSRLAVEPISYVKDRGLNHGFDVASIKLGNGKRLEVGKIAVLDSGTNILLLPKDLHQEMQEAMCEDATLSNCPGLWANECFDLTESQVDQYPPLSLELDGLTLEMTSRDYLLRGSPLAGSSGQYCLAIRDGGDAGFIVGDTTMRNYYVVFDFAQKRIGFAKVNRDLCGSISSEADAAASVIA